MVEGTAKDAEAFVGGLSNEYWANSPDGKVVWNTLARLICGCLT